MISIRNLTKHFDWPAGKVRVLDGLTLDVAAGETLALTGESGSGKSTLLHIAAALEPFDTGGVTIAGATLTDLNEAARARLRRDKIGLVFQQFNLIPSLTLSANVAFQARLAGRHDADWCAALIERLGLAGLEHRYPEELSGGQQQRVAIGRALAPRPPILLADEPTGNLDEESAEAVLDAMLGLVRDTGATLMMVTHSLSVAGRLGRRLHLSRGQISAQPSRDAVA